MDYARYREAVEVPPEMTQDGLAAAAWVELRHLSQYLHPLLDEELVRERTSHVKGIRQRRKVYDLSEAGQHAAYRLRDRVKAETVRVKDAAGVREQPLAEVAAAVGGQATLLDLVRRSVRTGVIDLEAIAAAPAAALVERLSEAPHVERFVGRDAELEALTAGDDAGARIYVVRGVAGIGKSSLAAKACERLRGRCNLFWHTLRPWDTRTTVLAELGEFLHALGKPALRSLVSRGETGEAPAVLREDLPGTQAFLVFDDAHEASPEVLALFGFLKDASVDAPDVRTLFLTRRALRFYDRRDVSVRKLVSEIDLAGLTSEDILSFLAPEWDAVVGNLGLQVGGHPLFLQLVGSLGRGEVHAGAMRDMDRFLEEEVYRDLSQPERNVLRLAALYRVPVPREALLTDPGVSHEVILSLVNRALLRLVGADAFEAHDAIRHFFAGLSTAAEREQLGAFALQQLRDLATQARVAGALVSCVGYLSNALLLASTPDGRADLYESLGDAEELLGDLPAALIAYKEAMKGRDGAEGRARLHRKSAAALRQRGKVDTATDEVENGLRLLGDTVCEERGWLEVVCCAIATWREQWDEAYERGDVALRMFRTIGSRAGEGWALYHLGFIDIEAPRGDPARGEEILRKALDLGVALDDVDLIARAHTGLAYLFAYRLGRVQASLEHLSAIEALPTTIRDPHARRSTVMLKGWIYLELLADCASAEGYFQEVTVLARKIHDSTAIISAHTGLARCTYYRGLVEEARRKFEDALAELLPTTLSVTAMEELWLAAECSLRLGDLTAFRRMASRLEDPQMSEAIRTRPLHAGVLRGVDRLLRGDRPGWREAFAEAFQAADRGSSAPDPAHLALVHFVYGVTLRAVGEEREAVEHLGSAKEILEAYHLMGRQAVIPAAERELAETLDRAVRAT